MCSIVDLRGCLLDGYSKQTSVYMTCYDLFLDSFQNFLESFRSILEVRLEASSSSGGGYCGVCAGAFLAHRLRTHRLGFTCGSFMSARRVRYSTCQAHGSIHKKQAQASNLSWMSVKTYETYNEMPLWGG